MIGQRVQAGPERTHPARHPPERPVRHLADCLARRTRPPALVCSTYGPGFTARLRARQPEHTLVSPDPASWPEGGNIRTVVLAGALDDVAEAGWPALLENGWRRLRAGGHLVVCAANLNDDRRGRAESGARRRRLARALKQFGDVRLAGDQPYRWVTMWARKAPDGVGRIPRTRRARYEATARLCHGRVVELGCGEGHLAGMIAAAGHEVVGVDLNRPKIERARRTYPAIEFLAADIADLALPEASFETALLAEVLEHVDEAVGAHFLAVAWRLLRPGGRLVVSVPNEDCIPHRNHIRTFDHRSLKALLRPLGRPRLITDQPYQWLMMSVGKQ